jgi:hypothetical protein
MREKDLEIASGEELPCKPRLKHDHDDDHVHDTA